MMGIFRVQTRESVECFLCVKYCVRDFIYGMLLIDYINQVR